MIRLQDIAYIDITLLSQYGFTTLSVLCHITAYQLIRLVP